MSFVFFLFREANLILSDENVILINKEKKPEKVEPEKVEHKEGEKENNVKVNKGKSFFLFLTLNANKIHHKGFFQNFIAFF